MRLCCRTLFQVQFEPRRNDCRESCSDVNWSISAWAWADRQCHLHIAVGRGKLGHTAQTSNQLIPMSPVTEKHSVDWPARTERTGSITDRANRTGAMGFLSIVNTEAWENTEILWYSQTMSLTNSWLWVLRHFYQVEHKKGTDIYSKLPTAALNSY